MAVEEISNSTYLDFTGYRIVPEGTTVQDAYGMRQSDINTNPTDAHINVAIVLARANAATDPNVSLLSENWATRQNALADQATIWSTYGADHDNYRTVHDALSGAGLTILDSSNSNYVSTQDSRTIWVELNTADDFNNLFGTALQKFDAPESSPYDSFVFWDGNLSLPTEWNVAGLWFDTDNVPNGSQITPVNTPALLPGAQSIGNNTTLTYTPPDAVGMTSAPLGPQDIAAFYNFPLAGMDVQTGRIGLIEPGVGSYLDDSADGVLGTHFQERLDAYLAVPQIDESGTGIVSVQGLYGQTESSGERSLDVGIVAAINPKSDITLYNGSGQNRPDSPGSSTGINGLPTTGFAQSSIYTAIQSSIWDADYAAVTSNSWGDSQSMSPGSPFYNAYWQLFIDAALRNQTTFIALGDGGSGNETANGLTNVEYNVTQPYNVLVGGTSLSTFNTAQADNTLNPGWFTSALAGDMQTIWQLAAGGLKTLPANAAGMEYFVETVWNSYYLQDRFITGSPDAFYYSGYYQNSTSSGGVDPTQPTPWYQAAYGLTPATEDPLDQPGRGVPDVSANAGGNLMYLVPTADMGGHDATTTADDGTSSAAPLWASLGVQLNAIFADQGLPNLGYMNDLLYIASAIAPASFNDVTLGSNTSSFLHDGTYETWNSAASERVHVTPTGYGYTAGYGYDYVSGLGTPNGVLLARALTQIAHAQTYSTSPDMLVSDGNGGWTSGADQALLFQTMSNNGGTVGVDLGANSYDYGSGNSAGYAWTNQFAQQSLQPDFDPNLVRMFDKQWQGAEAQYSASTGESLSVSVNGASASATQGLLSSPFGFADFVSDGGPGDGGSVVRVARAVAVAETAGGLDDQMAVVRLRQGGQDSLMLSFYKVDDLSGAIGGLHPGDVGYLQAAQQQVYQLSTGGTSIGGPGYGNYGQTDLLHVNAGDKIAMALLDQTSGQLYWPFAQANENVGGAQVSHLWNYGLNTWGWEDLYGGGDHDYNDMIVQLDFTSHSGSGWLVG